MNFVYRIKVDDRKVLADICADAALMAQSGLSAAEDLIAKEYANYKKVRGCPNSLSYIQLTPAQKRRLLTLYSGEVKGLEFIERIRNETCAGACPMCGKLGTHTVEHFVEKGPRPQFAIFSPNLVPSCSCNTRRVACVIAGKPAKPLHPFFDKIGRRRLMRAHFSGDFGAPDVDVIPCRALGRYRSRVDAHIRCIVKTNQVSSFLLKRWEALVEVPARSLALTHVAPSSVTFHALRARIKELEDAEAHNSGSVNNWISIFYAGVAANQNAVRGILRRLNGEPKNVIRGL